MDSTTEIITVASDVNVSSSNMTSLDDGDGGESQIDATKSTVKDCYFYSMGVVIPTGLLCNAFCLTVCAMSHGFRRTTTGHYLMALAIADSLFLVGDLMRWLNSSDSTGRSYR